MEKLLSCELSERAEHLVWTELVLLAVVNVVAFVGNLSVCFAMHRNQRLHALSNMFVAALAVSDILISTGSILFSVVTLAHGRWIFGANVCRFQRFAMYTFALASFVTVRVIAVSRYFCVVKPVN